MTDNEEFFGEDIADQDETPQEETAPEEELSEGGETPSEEEQTPQYWQSQYDKLKAEHDQIAEQKERIDKYVPLLEYLDDPRTLSAIEAQLSGQTAVKPQPANGRAEEASQDSPEDILSKGLPERPKMPADRFNDEAMDAYFQKRDEYEAAVDQVVKAQQRLMNQQQETQREQQQLQQKRVEAHDYLQKRYGASSQEAAQFMQDYQDPRMVAQFEEQLFKLWRANRNEQPKEEPIDAERLRRLKNGNGNPPAPGATVPGAQEVQEEEDPFLFMR